VSLGFELAYGHAFKVQARLPVAPVTTISLEEMRDQVRAPRGHDNPSSGLR
jgi:hypothetical protein